MMHTTVAERADAERYTENGTRAHALDGWMVLPGRAFFAMIFFLGGVGHFSPQTIAFAAEAGVPLASIAVPLSGVIAFVGALSILLGYRARLGAGLLVLFLVPVTLTMDAFWAIDDPMMAGMQQAMFFKNLSMLGGALLIMHFGAGPLSLDARRARQGKI